MIALERVRVRAGTFALDDVSFSIATGAHVALMGKTGSGKTTILETIAGLRMGQGGRILLDGDDVTGSKAAERGVGYVPQDLALFQSMTVSEHLAFALVLRRWPRDAVRRRVEELAELLGLGKLLTRKPAGLSGGEAQRVALGRALTHHPPILLLDEPLSALDDETHEEMCVLLQSVQRQTHVTTLHVTHNRAEAKRLADRLLLLRDGRISEAPAGWREGVE
jgi:ABC-type sugar transport system ATPase subunit